MRKMIFSLLLAFLLLLVAPALAQPNVWIQIEAQPSLGKAQERARIYSGRLDHVNGFSLSSGWYAIALGPFTRPDALEATEGDSGGPVFDATGAVMGVLLPDGTPPGRKLPQGVAFATGAAEIARFLEGNGIEPLRTNGGERTASEDLTILAADMTVLVSCWN